MLDFEISKKTTKNKDIPLFVLISLSIKDVSNEGKLHEKHMTDYTVASINVNNIIEYGSIPLYLKL